MKISTVAFLIKGSSKQRAIFLALFTFILLLIGVGTYKDYGISWDERVERIDGAVALRYIQQKSGIQIPGLESMLEKQQYSASLELDSYKDRYYPVGFNLPIEAAIRYLGVESEQEAYYFRHLITFLICLLGALALFFLAERRFADWRIGALTALMYVLSPRLYGEWFYNSKDLVLLSLFVIATYSAISYLLTPSYRNAFLFAIATAFAMNIRLMAVVLPLLVFGFLLVQVIQRRAAISRVLAGLILFICVVFGLLFLGWPLLWESPAQQLLDALRFMAKYQFYQDTLYMGSVIPSTKLPWHYLSVWVGITTPVAYLIFWFVGLCAILFNLYKARWRLWSDDNEMQDLFFLALFLGPLLGFMVLRPVIYDGWRHFYFIYPAFLLVSVRGIFTACNASPHLRQAKIFVSCLLGISLLSSAVWMILAHPLQNVYFNNLIGSNWKSKFDVDYWGLSNRQALKDILASDAREKIYIKDGAYNFIPLSLSMLSEQDAKRLAFTIDDNQADYLITNYRLNATDYAAMPSNWQLYKNIYAGKEIISSMYQAKRLIYAPQVKVGKPISFGKESYGQYFLYAGNWALPEAWGVWAQSRKAYADLPFPTNSKQKLTGLTLNLRALVSSRYPEQRIAIRLDGGLPTIFNLKSLESNLIQLRLPEDTRSARSRLALRVEIESFNPVEPSRLGMGNDDRPLSVGLVSATFE